MNEVGKIYYLYLHSMEKCIIIETNIIETNIIETKRNGYHTGVKPDE